LDFDLLEYLEGFENIVFQKLHTLVALLLRKSESELPQWAAQAIVLLGFYIGQDALFEHVTDSVDIKTEACQVWRPR